MGQAPTYNKDLSTCVCQHFTLSVPNQQVYSPHCAPYISYATSWEILFIKQGISSWVIISFIPLT